MTRMKPGVTYFKYSVLLICFIIGALLFRGCKCGKERVIEIPIIKIDTFWNKQDTFISYLPKPHKVYVPNNVEIPVLSDSLLLANVIKDEIISHQLDSLAILRDYLTTRYYDDSFPVKYGMVRVKDTVFANSLMGHGISTSFNLPVIKETYTIEAQKRNVVLFGVGAIGNKTSPLFGTEVTIDLKNKHDRIYEIGGLLLNGGELYYKASIKWPIRLTKK